MGRRKPNPPPRQIQQGKFKSQDSFVNLQARLGYGAGSQQDGGTYSQNYISRNRLQLEAAYRTNWVCGLVVDVVAQDMTRAGAEITSELPPDDMDKLYREMERLGVWNSLCDTAKWSRLYGGAIAVMLIDGQKPDTPLRLDTVSKGSFKGLLVLDRWVVQPSLNDLVTEYGPDMGKPKFYQVIADAQAMVNMNIHYSRVIRLDGIELPYWQKIAENGWGQSVVERMWDRIIAFDSTTEGAAQLVFKAHLRTYGVKGLRDIIATGGKSFDGLVKQIEMIRQFQSNEGMTMMDSDDVFEAHSYTFAGLPDMLLQFGQQLSGASQIPLVRLFGQSPAGLNSTGESDLRTYYDNIAQQQDRQLRNPLNMLYDIVSRSVLDAPLPEGFAVEFRPLWQMTDAEKATTSKTITEAVLAAEESGVIGRSTALKELRQSSHTTGIFSNITDEEIEEAENEPPAPTELEMTNANGQSEPGQNQESGAGVSGAA